MSTRRMRGTGGCAGKKPFSTRKRALSAGGFRSSKGNAPKLYAYKCRDCHEWHLTSWTPEEHAERSARRASRPVAASPVAGVHPHLPPR